MDENPMQLTKFTHSCVRVAAAADSDPSRTLVIDPGGYSELDEALAGISAILITHQHPDHVDVDRVRAAVAADPALIVYAPAGAAGALSAAGGLGDQLVVVAPGDVFGAAGFTVRAVGGVHAQIHPRIPLVDNVGYLIDGVYHPGDALFVPVEPVSTLLLPNIAPWAKAAEVIDFAISVRASAVHQIHDALSTEAYQDIVGGMLQRLLAPFGVAYQPWQPGDVLSA